MPSEAKLVIILQDQACRLLGRKRRLLTAYQAMEYTNQLSSAALTAGWAREIIQELEAMREQQDINI